MRSTTDQIVTLVGLDQPHNSLLYRRQSLLTTYVSKSIVNPDSSVNSSAYFKLVKNIP